MDYIAKVSEILGGVKVPTFPLDGTLHRFGKRKVCWAVGFKWIYKEKEYWIVKGGDWSKPGSSFEVKSYDDLELNKFSKKTAEKYQSRITATIKEDKKTRNKMCAEKSVQILRTGEDPVNHPYLKKKQIHSFGVKVEKGVLKVPVYKGKYLVGIQYIAEDGKKWFEPGTDVKGAYFPLTPIEGQRYVYLAEGFATAASVQMCTTAPVICCFNAGNLVEVVKRLNTHDGPFMIICGDRDKVNKNTGLRAGESTFAQAKMITNKCSVVWPWDDVEKVGDFNDLHVEKDLNEVMDRIKFEKGRLKRNYKIEEEATGFTVYDEDKNKYIRRPEKLLRHLMSFFPYKYIPELKTFYIFNGKFYEARHENYMKVFAQQMYSPECTKESERMEFLNMAKSHNNAKPDILSESDPSYICFQNGILDLKQGKRVPHTSDIFTTRMIPHDLDFNAECPTYDKMMYNLLGDENLVNQANEFLGFALSGCDYSRFQKFVVFSGDGSNGKTTVIDTWKQVLGIKNTSAAMIGDLHKDKFLAAQLQDSLLNISEEERVSVFKDTSVLKRVTGNSPMIFEKKGKDAISGINKAKVIISYNKVPKLNDTTYGMKRRMIILPFKVNLEDEPHKRIENVKDLLADEISGIINRAIEGMIRLHENGKFTKTHHSDEAFDEMASDSNPMFDFVDSMISVSKAPDAHVLSSDIFEKFKAFSEDPVEDKQKSWAMRSFGSALKARKIPFSIKKTTKTTLNGPKNDKKYLGIVLK